MPNDGSTTPVVTLALNEDEITQLKAAISDYAKGAPPKKKDGWDKAAILSQFLSGFVIAVVGIIVAVYTHISDDRHKETELLLADKQHAADLDLANRKGYLDYLVKLADEERPERQAQLLDLMEAELTPQEAVRTALNYLHPVGSLQDKAIVDNQNLVRDRAFSVVVHLKGSALDDIREVSESDRMPDREIAKGLLGMPTKVLVRVSGVDDFADLILNDSKVIFRGLAFGQDTGWHDITPYLRKSDVPGDHNVLKFTVTNGQAGGYGGRLQISAGVSQYDTGPYAVNSCPCNKPAFEDDISVKANSKNEIEVLGHSFKTFPM